MKRSGLGRGGPQRTHGLSKHPLYGTWGAIMQRCHGRGSASYKWYGGRGIRMCDEWHDPAVFISWMESHIGLRPEPGMTLDRFDGNYEPGNVRWARKAEQQANRRPYSRRAALRWPASGRGHAYGCDTRDRGALRSSAWRPLSTVHGCSGSSGWGSRHRITAVSK
jgi:hypothetical protein